MLKKGSKIKLKKASREWLQKNAPFVELLKHNDFTILRIGGGPKDGFALIQANDASQVKLKDMLLANFDKI